MRADGETPAERSGRRWLGALIAVMLLTPVVSGWILAISSPWPLYGAFTRGRVALAAGLMAVGADPNARLDGAFERYAAAETMLHAAVVLRDETMTRMLLAAGADPDPRDSQGRTPLYLAAAPGLDAISGTLLDAGADPNAESDSTGTPLFPAATWGRVAVARRLLEAGAEPDRATVTGVTPLIVAARKGHAEIVRLLIERGAHLDAFSAARRWSPLHAAAFSGGAETVEVLLGAGADPCRRNVDGLTAHALAVAREEPEIAERLWALMESAAEARPECRSVVDS